MKETSKKTENTGKLPFYKRRFVRTLLLRLSTVAVFLLLVLQVTLYFFSSELVGSYLTNLVNAETKGKYHLNYSLLRINFILGRVEFSGVEFYPDKTYVIENEQKLLTERQNIFHIKAPVLHLKGTGIRKALWHKEWSVKDIFLDSLDFTIHQYRPQKPKHQRNTQYTEKVKGLKKFAIEELTISHSSVTIHKHLKPTDKPITINDLSFTLEGLNIEPKRGVSGISSVFEDMELKFGKNTIHIPNSKYLLHIEHAIFSAHQEYVLLKGVKVEKEGQKYHPTLFKSDEVAVINFNLDTLLMSNKIKADYLTIYSPVLSLSESELKPKNKVAADSLPKGKVPSIHFDSLSIVQGKVEIRRKGKPDFLVPSLSFEGTNVKIKKEGFGKKHKRPFRIEEFVLKLEHQPLLLDNRTHLLKADRLEYKSKYKHLYVQDLKVKPTAKPTKTKIEGTIPRIHVYGVDLEHIGKEGTELFRIDVEYPNLKLTQFPNITEKRNVDLTSSSPSKKSLSFPFSIEEVNIVGGELDIINPKKHQIAIDALDITIRDIKEGYQLAETPVHIDRLRSDEVSVILPAMDQKVSVDSVYYDDPSKQLTLFHIGLDTLGGAGKLMLNGKIESIAFPDIDYQLTHNKYDFYTDSVIINEPKVEIINKETPRIEEEDTAVEVKSSDLPIDFGTHLIKVVDGDFSYRKEKGHINVSGVNLFVEEIDLEERDTTALDEQYFPFTWKNLNANIENVDILPPDSIQVMTLDKVEINYQQGLLSTQDLKLIPLINAEGVSGKIEGKLGDVNFYGLNFESLLRKRTVEADSLSVEDISAFVAARKSMTNDTQPKKWLRKIDIGQIKGGFKKLNFGSDNNIEVGNAFCIIDSLRYNIEKSDSYTIKDGEGWICNLDFRLKRRPAKVALDSVYFSTKDSVLSIINFKRTPYFNPELDDLIDNKTIVANRIHFTGFPLGKYITDRHILVDTVIIDSPKVTTYQKHKGNKDVANVAGAVLSQKDFQAFFKVVPKLSCNKVIVKGGIADLKVAKTNNELPVMSKVFKRVNHPVYIRHGRNSEENKKIKNELRYLSRSIRRKLKKNMQGTTKGTALSTMKLQPDDSLVDGMQNDLIGSQFHDYIFHDINIELDTLQLDSLDSDIHKLETIAKSIDVNIGHNFIVTEDSLFGISFNGLEASSRTGKVVLKQGAYVPLVPFQDFSKIKGYQTDGFMVRTQDVEIEGVDFSQILFDNSLYARAATVRGMHLFTFRDKTVPLKRDRQNPKLPIALLKSLPFPLTLDTLFCINGAVVYEEYIGTLQQRKSVEKFGYNNDRIGRVEINKISGGITNITNRPDVYEIYPKMVCDVNGYFMGGAEVRMKVTFMLNSDDETHYIEGWMRNMDIRKLNPLLEELVLLRITEGKSKGLYFMAKANEDRAYGNMHFRYRGLKVEILKEKFKKKTGQLKKKGVITSLANEMFLRQENPSFMKLRDGNMYFERDKSKFIFNYWGKLMLSGILSSTSITKVKPDDPEVKKEIKMIEKVMKKSYLKKESKGDFHTVDYSP